MLTVINGYKTVKSVSPTVFASILKEIRDCVLNAQEKQYNLLFGEEINRLADMYVLDYTSISEGVSVWDECVNRLNIRIDNDSRSNADTRYNFNVTIEIMPHKNVWYFNIVGSNEMLVSHLLDPIGKLESFSVVTGEDVVNPTEEAAKVWEEIRKEYSGKKIPMRQFYYPQFPFQIDEAALVLESVNERAKTNAENNEFAEVFNTLCRGRQLAPFEMPKLYEEALKEIAPFEMPKLYEEALKEIDSNPHHRENIRLKYTTLSSVLPILTIDMLKNPCGMKAPAAPEASTEGK